MTKFGQIYPGAELKHSRKIIGFRNRLIHAYDSIDNSITWTIIQGYLDPLKKEVQFLLDE